MEIVLVDDNDEFRHLLGQVLTRAGHSVRTAANAPDARHLMAQGPVDLLIADIIMPNEDGLMLMTSVRRQYPDTSILGISGASVHSPLYLNIASKLGATATLLKPFSPDELMLAVARIEFDRATRTRAEKDRP
jgi:DNA-binding NtrC family response regulator